MQVGADLFERFELIRCRFVSARCDELSVATYIWTDTYANVFDYGPLESKFLLRLWSFDTSYLLRLKEKYELSLCTRDVDAVEFYRCVSPCFRVLVVKFRASISSCSLKYVIPGFMISSTLRMTRNFSSPFFRPTSVQGSNLDRFIPKYVVRWFRFVKYQFEPLSDIT